MISRLLTFVSMIWLIASCEPVPRDADLLEDLVVRTEYDESIDFSQYNTFTLTLDTLGLISNSFVDTLIINDYSKAASQRLRQNLEQRGYSRVPKNANPDLGVTAFVVYDFNVFQTISYPNYNGGFYSPYYGYYYPIVNTYATNQGLLIIQIVDLKQKNSQNQFRTVWSSVIGDIVATINAFDRSVEGIDQAFLQTPTLTK